MKVAVTGAAGFIGYHLAGVLIAQGDEVIGLDNFDPYYDVSIKKRRIERLSSHSSFRFHDVDLRDSGSLVTHLRGEMPDVVVHLAARAGVRSSVKDMYTYFELNVRGTLSLVEAMKQLHLRSLVFASSSSVYGGTNQVPFRETNHNLNPLSPYGITKLSCEYYLNSYAKINGMSIIMLRIFTCYGPEQRPDMAFHKFAWSIIKGEPVTLFNNGSPRRDFTFVQDAVESIRRAVGKAQAAAQAGGARVLNIASSKPVSIGYAVELLQRNLGRKAVIKYEPLSVYEPEITYGDNTEAGRFLGYTPMTSIEDGIKVYCEWVKSMY